MTLFRYRIFFILKSLNTNVPIILHTKFQPNIPCHSGENVDFIGLAIYYQWHTWNLDQTEFYQSEALESDHTACEIWDSWMQWSKRISQLKGLKCYG